MHIFGSNEQSSQFFSRNPAESDHLYTREQEMSPPTRYGIMIALAISSGAFSVACIGLAIALCDWRMRYLHLRKYLDERGFAIPERTTTRQEAAADESGGQEAGEARASGAL
ncbi:hypothetical protein E4U21_002385 [Claviceps maximensis]|nr:hypothetical protein E4U21_002385 [Claviceps maximensis]